MVGMSAALALAQLGLHVALVEKEYVRDQQQAAYDGRVSAVALGSRYFLQNVQAWEGMEAFAQPIHTIHVSDASAPVFLNFDHQAISGEPFGYIVENRVIRHALLQAVKAQPLITLMEGEVVTHHQALTGCVSIETKTSLFRASLLVAADGKNSPLRAKAGIGVIHHSYHQTALVCSVQHEHPHEAVAQERFLPGGPFAVLPMQGNKSSLVWVEQSDRAGAYLSLPQAECEEEIATRMGDYYGRIRMESALASYPLSLDVAKTYIAPRLVLIGDAAHAIHPLAGQGVNLGFRDVEALAETLRHARAVGGDIGSQSVLEHYQRRRRFDNATMIAMTDGLNRLFGTYSTPFVHLRRVGMKAVNHSLPLKRFFMRHAMGIAK